MQQWTPKQLSHYLNHHSIQMLDVREKWEYEIASIQGAVLIPLGQLTQTELPFDKTAPIVAICHHGVRSAHACFLLTRNGYEMINLIGGIEQWAREIDHNMPIY